MGIASGILGGMGMGGGTILIPAVTLLLGWEQQPAQWLNLVSFVPSAVVALIVHVKHRLVDFKASALMLIPAMGACVGMAYLATRLEGRILTLCFGSFLVVIGVCNLIISIKNAVLAIDRRIPREPDEI